MTCHICGDPPTRFLLMHDLKFFVGGQRLLKRAYCDQCFSRSSLAASMIGQGKVIEASNEDELLVFEIMER